MTASHSFFRPLPRAYSVLSFSQHLEFVGLLLPGRHHRPGTEGPGRRSIPPLGPILLVFAEPGAYSTDF